MTRVVDIRFGGFRVKTMRERELLGIWVPPRPAIWKSTPPEFRAGMRADHLSVPIKPRRRKGRLEWSPHLTYPGKGHHSLVELDVDVVTSAMVNFTQEVSSRILRSLIHVVPEQLYREEFIVMAPRKRQFHELFERWIRPTEQTARTDRYTFTAACAEQQLASMGEMMRWLSPLALDSKWGHRHKGPLQAIRLNERDELETYFLYYFPKAGGWYLGKQDQHQVVADVMDAMFGATINQAMFAICRELQIDCDVDRLRARCGLGNSRLLG